MTFANLPGLIFLFAIPYLLVLYLVRTRPEHRTISSSELWRRLLRRRNPQGVLQRYRKSLFLILHILLLTLGALLLASPRIPGGLRGPTLLVLDTSASMSATDLVGGTRLDAARERLLALLRKLDTETPAALMTLDEVATLLVPSTLDRGELRASLAAITTRDVPGPDTSQLHAYLRSVPPGTFTRVAVASDGLDWDDISDLPGSPSLLAEGVGSSAENLGITQFDASPGAAGLDLHIRVTNFGQRHRVFSVAVDEATAGESRQLQVLDLEAPPRRDATVTVPGVPRDLTALRVRIASHGGPDYLASDDTASLVFSSRAGHALVVSRPDSPLRRVARPEILGLAVDTIDPSTLEQDPTRAASARLILADGVDHPSLDRRPLLLFSPLSGSKRTEGPVRVSPHLLVTDTTHPVMRYVDLAETEVLEALRCDGGGEVLIASEGGPLMAAYQGEDEERQVIAAFPLTSTNLADRVAYPILISNAVRWLLGKEGLAGTWSRAGQVPGVPETAGLHWVQTPRGPTPHAVNLLSFTESDIAPRDPPPELHFVEHGKTGEGTRPIERELLLALVVLLLVEWLLYLELEAPRRER